MPYAIATTSDDVLKSRFFLQAMARVDLSGMPNQFGPTKRRFMRLLAAAIWQDETRFWRCKKRLESILPWLRSATHNQLVTLADDIGGLSPVEKTKFLQLLSRFGIANAGNNGAVANLQLQHANVANVVAVANLQQPQVNRIRVHNTRGYRRFRSENGIPSDSDLD